MSRDFSGTARWVRPGLSEGAASIRAVPLDFTAVDFETAGPSSASACSVGVVVVQDGRVVEKAGWLIRPPAGHDVFSEWNIRIHGITPDRVVDAAGWAEQMDDLLAAFGERPVVAHNARFDMGVIRAACSATGVPTPALDYFCSLQIARRTYSLHSYRLPVAAAARSVAAAARPNAQPAALPASSVSSAISTVDPFMCSILAASGGERSTPRRTCG